MDILELLFKNIKLNRNTHLPIVKYKNFINSVNRHIEDIIDIKYKPAYPVNSPAITYLQLLINQVDISHLLNIENDIELIFYIRRNLLDMYYSKYISSVPMLTNTFIKPLLSDIDEFIIYYTEPNNIKDYNFKNKDINYWLYDDKLNPLSLVYIDTNELTVDILNSQLLYSSYPTTAIISVNIEKLLFTYVKYLQLAEGEDLIHFYYKRCLIGLIKSATNIWVINILNDLLHYDKKDIINKHIDFTRLLYYNPNSNINLGLGNVLKSTFKSFILDIVKSLSKTITTNINPNDLLNNLSLPFYDLNMLTYIKDLLDNKITDDNINVRWINFLSYINLLNILIDTLTLPDIKDTRLINFKKKFISMYKIYKGSRFWNKCPNIILRTKIEDLLDELNEKITNV